MESKLDNLFREKLEQHSIPPSAKAWERAVTSDVTSRGSFTWAWRIAAAILLFGIGSWFLVDSIKEKEQTQVAKEVPAKTNVEGNVEVEKKFEPKDSERGVVENGNKNQVAFNLGIVSPIHLEENKTLAQTPEDNMESVEVISDEREDSEALALVERETENRQVGELVAPRETEKTFVIVYSLPTVEAAQEVEPVKTNGFKKVIEFAKDVKGGDVTLASVRDWKDNLLTTDGQRQVEKQNINN